MKDSYTITVDGYVLDDGDKFSPSVFRKSNPGGWKPNPTVGIGGEVVRERDYSKKKPNRLLVNTKQFSDADHCLRQKEGNIENVCIVDNYTGKTIHNGPAWQIEDLDRSPNGSPYILEWD